MTTHFSGPVVSTAGFTGNVTGNLTGNVTGNVVGNLTGNVTGNVLPPVTSYSLGVAEAISPADFLAILSKTTPAGSFTLAAPGAGNVGKTLYGYTATALAHVVTVTGLAGGTTLTFTAAVGNGFALYATSASVWTLIYNLNVTQS